MMTVACAFGSGFVTFKSSEVFLFPAAQGSAARRTRQKVAVFMFLLLSIDRNGSDFARRGCIAPDHVVAPHHVEAAHRGIAPDHVVAPDRKSTRLNSSHRCISYAVFCLNEK